MSSNITTRLTALLLGALLAVAGFAPGAARALPDVCEGTVVATASTAITAQCDARVADIAVIPGQTVAQGEALLTLRPEKVFAHSDGTAVAVKRAAGEYCSGALVTVERENVYTIHCSIEDAYDSPETMYVHMGEILYVKCKKDGSHRAIARVTGIDGSGYTLETLGGELYVGEAVYVFRDDEFSSKQRTGAGTVVSADVDEYEAVGCVTRVLVEPGDPVERGQLLYEYLPGGDAAGADMQLTSSACGIVTSISAQEGLPLTDGAVALTIAPADSLRISVLLSESDAGDVAEGAAVSILLPWQEYEDSLTGTVESISPLPQTGDEAQTVYEALIALPDTAQLRMGMSATVAFIEE